MRLVVGAFDVRKPYFNLDPGLVYKQLGTVRHRGLEISLAGEPVKGLNVVAGAVLMKPRVTRRGGRPRPDRHQAGRPGRAHRQP